MSAETIVQLFIPFALGVIMLAMGLALTVGDFRRILERPRAIAAGAFAQIVLLPLLGFAVAWGWSLPTTLAVGMVLIASCPGGPSSNLYAHLAGGDTALSVSLTAVSGLVTIVTIPLIVNFAMVVFAGETTPVPLPVADTILRIFLVVGLPLALGMWIRARRPRLADRLETWTKRAAVLLLIVLVIGAVLQERAQILDFVALAGVPVMVLNGIGMLLGLTLALSLRLPRDQTVTITIEVGMQNGAMAIGIALALLDSTEVAIPAVLYGLLAYVTVALVGVAGNAWLRSDARVVPT